MFVSLGLRVQGSSCYICFHCISPAILLPSLCIFKNNSVHLQSTLVFTRLTNFFVIIGDFNFNSWSFARLFINMLNSAALRNSISKFHPQQEQPLTHISCILSLTNNISRHLPLLKQVFPAKLIHHFPFIPSLLLRN